jgi:uncharacterized protein YvpB
MEKNIINEQEKLRTFRVENLKKLSKLKKIYKLPIEVRIKKIMNKKGLKIFLVDGSKIRQFIDMDFTMGGHGFRYIYVPLDEIWIDSSNELECEEVVAHEIHEFNLMKKGINYQRAHEQASLVELALRNKQIILPVGHFLQKHWWSCGPSSLKIVLDYYGYKVNFKEIVKGTNPNNLSKEDVTLHEDLIGYLKKLRLKYSEKSNSKIKDIERFIQEGIPVIVDYQDRHFYLGGHFAVIIGYDDKRFRFSNPSLKRKYEWITKKDFEKNWWAEDKPGKIVKRWMLAVYRRN